MGSKEILERLNSTTLLQPCSPETKPTQTLTKTKYLLIFSMFMLEFGAFFDGLMTYQHGIVNHGLDWWTKNEGSYALVKAATDMGYWNAIIGLMFLNFLICVGLYGFRWVLINKTPSPNWLPLSMDIVVSAVFIYLGLIMHIIFGGLTWIGV